MGFSLSIIEYISVYFFQSKDFEVEVEVERPNTMIHQVSSPDQGKQINNIQHVLHVPPDNDV